MKIGFIVEGDTDKAIVEALARRIVPKGVRLHAVRLGSKIALPWAYTSVIELLRKNYDHVLVVYDTDTTEETLIAGERAEVERPLEKYGLQDRTTVIPVVPNVEAWLDPDSAGNGKRKLSPREAENATAKLDVARASRRFPELARFVQTLQSVTSRRAKVGA